MQAVVALLLAVVLEEEGVLVSLELLILVVEVVMVVVQVDLEL